MIVILEYSGGIRVAHSDEEDSRRGSDAEPLGATASCVSGAEPASDSSVVSRSSFPTFCPSNLGQLAIGHVAVVHSATPRLTMLIDCTSRIKFIICATRPRRKEDSVKPISV